MPSSSTVDPRAEARERVGGRYDVRVLEPSPPAVTEPPWFADDPVNPRGKGTGTADGGPLVTPVSGIGDLTWDELARAEPDLARWCADRWLGAWRRLAPVPDPEALRQTRESWHALAEHVLAAARHRANGKIGLRFTRGGFGTPFFGADEQVRVEGHELLVIRSGQITRAPITTLGAAGTLVGVEPGAPLELFTPTTQLARNAPLTVDHDAAALLGDWFGFACSVLEELRAGSPFGHGAGSDDPSRVQLWPEHFDLSVDLGDADTGRRGTYGASPGDDAHSEPYLYVTHWVAQPADPYWNEITFDGASLSYAELVDEPDQRAAALEFFGRGYSVLNSVLNAD